MRSGIHCATCMLLAALCGCASSQSRQTEVATAHRAGLDAAFEMLQQSGISVVRMEGPFLRPVILWHEGLTLAQALVEAGYQAPGAPSRILLRHQGEIEQVDVARLLAGEDVVLGPGMIIHALP